MTSLRLALLGYGRMGKHVEHVALERGHQVVVRAHTAEPVTADQLRQADAALDFSSASAVERHVALCTAAGVPLVLGTTGWSDNAGMLATAAERIGIVVGANFSIGVAMTVRLAALLAQMLSPALGYQLHIHETHHRAKRDHPSGTALLLARTLRQHLPYPADVHASPESPPSDAITISSARVGSIAGIHTIVADSASDTIEITHTAKSRRGFALGAVLAAEWIVGRRGLFNFAEIAFEVIAQASK